MSFCRNSLASRRCTAGRPSGATPYMRVEKLRYRSNPTLTCALMADGASEQAASIEETSSSLEEMSSMTKQNADNARQAKALVDSTAGAAERSAGSSISAGTW